MMSCVFGCRRAISRKSGTLLVHSTLTGMPAAAPASITASRPGWSASISTYLSTIRAPTTPGFVAHSSTCAPTVSERGSNGAISPNRSGYLAPIASA